LIVDPDCWIGLNQLVAHRNNPRMVSRVSGGQVRRVERANCNHNRAERFGARLNDLPKYVMRFRRVVGDKFELRDRRRTND
jgi:hypothetical protein